MLKIGIGAFIVAEVAMAGFFMVIAPGLHRQAPIYAEAALTVQQAPLAHAMSGWLYYDTRDSVVGDVTHHARLISNSPVNPVSDKRAAGATTGTLELSASTRYGRVVQLSFPHVQTGCEANPCEVRAIFDQTQPMVLGYTDASSDNKTVLMLKDYDHFTQRLAVAHDLTMVAALGTAHDHVLRFDVAGYRRLEIARAGDMRGATQLAAR